MPGALAHAFFALECLEADGNDPLLPRGMRDIAKNHLDLVLAGSQGPDPFYFHAMVPWRRRPESRRVHGFADWLHASKPGEFIFSYLGALAVVPDHGVRTGLGAYLYGLMLHYLLDRRVHPYVYSRSGFDESGGLSGIYGAHHARFETLMDSCLARQKEKAVLRTALDGFARLNPAIGTLVSGFHAAAFPDRSCPEDFLDSWTDFVTIQNFMNDPHGIRHCLLSLGMGKDSRAAALARPAGPRKKDPRDYTNETQSPWPDPVSGNSRRESLQDLWALAASERAPLLELVLGAMERRLPETGGVNQALLCWSLSMEGGMKVTRTLEQLNHEGLRQGEKMVYSQPCMGK